MYAGFQNCTGDYAVVMDADLQHPPAMLADMYRALTEEHYDIAAARRVDRKGEPAIRSFFARCFYKIINKISKAEFVDGASDFRMLNRQSINALLEMKEYNRFSKGIFGWIGFKTKWIPYENVERVAGETTWSFWNLLLYSLEGFVAFTTIPLSIASVMGIAFCIIALLWMVGIILKTLIFGDPVAGFPTLACLLLLIGGSIQLSLGIIGQYLAKRIWRLSGQFTLCRKRKRLADEKSFLDATLIRFVIVGVINTGVGTAIMFGLYNLAHCTYWVSSASNYILTSIFKLFP